MFGKTSSNSQLVVRIQPNIKKKFKTWCNEHDISMMKMIEQLIMEAIKKEGK